MFTIGYKRVLLTTIIISKATTPAMVQNAKLAMKQPKKRRKKPALGDDLQSQAAQFVKLPDHADAIRIADPKATTILATEDRDGVRRFHRFFVCPCVIRHAFEYCCCFLTMDGTFTKEIFNLTVLLAISVLVAWALVEGESVIVAVVSLTSLHRGTEPQ